jgi:hypothetical protein
LVPSLEQRCSSKCGKKNPSEPFDQIDANRKRNVRSKERGDWDAAGLDFRRRRVMRGGFRLSMLPRPAVLHFQVQGEAKEGADENNQPKDDDTVQGGIYNDGVDNIAGDKEFEPEQNRSSHILATKAIRVNRNATSQEEEANHGKGRSNHHDSHTRDLDCRADNFNDLSVM